MKQQRKTWMAKGQADDCSEPDLLTVQEFARRLSISVWTARQWAYRGKVASVKLGTRLQVPLTEVSRLIAEGLRPQIADCEGNQ